MNEGLKKTKVDMFFDLSNCCNYNCIFCRNDILERKLVKIEDIKNFNELLKNAKSVDITGYGEISVHPQFLEYLTYFKNLSIPVRFVTNGSQLNSDMIDKLIESSVNEIIVSLNSMNYDTYQKLTNRDVDVNQIIEGIEKLVERNKTRENKIKIVLSFVMNSYNLKEVPQFIDFAKKLGIPLSLLDLTPTIKNYEEGLMIEDNFKNRHFLNNMKKYAQHEVVDLAVFNFDNRKTTNTGLDEAKLREVVKRCDWLRRYTFIATNGDVGICCWSDYKIGNIFQNSIEEIRNGSKFMTIKNCIRTGDTTYCKNCRREG